MAAVILLVSGVLAIPALVWFLVRNERRIYQADESFRRKFGTFFEEFKLEQPIVKQMFYPLFCLRRLVYALSLYLLTEWPLLQVGANALGTVAVLAHAIKYKPFKEVETQTITVTSEIAILINFLLGPLFLLDLSDEVSFLVFSLIFGSLAGIVCVAYFFVFRNLCSKLKTCLKKKKKKHLPHLRVVPACIAESRYIQPSSRHLEDLIEMEIEDEPPLDLSNSSLQAPQEEEPEERRLERE